MKQFLIILSMAIGSVAFGQTTATNFSSNDCQGNPHDLFAELDSGKVVVLDWVMPCASCVGPSLTAYNVVQSYASSHPGRVRFYVADDFGTSSCNSLNYWCSTNGMPGTTTFSNPIIDMDDYGGAGMPKIVVLGWRSHRIFFNENNGAGTLEQLIAAVDSALAEPPLGMPELGHGRLDLFPNPVKDVLNLDFDYPVHGTLKVRVTDLQGRELMAMGRDAYVGGGNRLEIPVGGLSTGMYFLRVEAGGKQVQSKFWKQ